jgi:hypothetical protein
MYPHLLTTRDYPTSLQRVEHDISPTRAGDILRHYACVGVVTIGTRVPEYPMRREDGTDYPVGDYVTALAGEELRRAIAEGCVHRVHRLAVYRVGRPFASWGRWVLGQRARCRAEDDAAGEQWYKCLANAFSGKWHQRQVRWAPRPDVIPPEPWGPWVGPDPRTGESHTWRTLAGLAHRREEGGQSGRLLGAVYGYLTAYGRTMMRDIRELIGRDGIVSQDTDGLWLTDLGRTKLEMSSCPLGSDPGMMRHVESVTYFRGYTARHYYTPGRWVMAGVAPEWAASATGRLTARQRADAIRRGPVEPPTSTAEVYWPIPLPRIPRGTPVDQRTGWLRPVELPTGRIVGWGLPESLFG